MDNKRFVNLKKMLDNDVSESLNNYLNYDYVEDEYTGQYTGTVINNDDKDKHGRCQIRIFGVHSDNIQDKDLPWALPDFNFIGGLKGSFIVPPVDCVVNVYFENGDIYLPRYTTKTVNTNSMPTNKDDDYPNNMIFYETDNGDKFEINRKTKETTFEHSSGTKLTIDSLGNVVIDSVKSITTKHGLFLEDSGSSVVPGPKGPYNCMPICPLAGIQHIGNKCAP